ncbi:MAG: hypothetical protein R2882_11585 [Gemmatimonadales bacterium]
MRPAVPFHLARQRHPAWAEGRVRPYPRWRKYRRAGSPALAGIRPGDDPGAVDGAGAAALRLARVEAQFRAWPRAKPGTSG